MVYDDLIIFKTDYFHQVWKNLKKIDGRTTFSLMWFSYPMCITTDETGEVGWEVPHKNPWEFLVTKYFRLTGTS